MTGRVHVVVGSPWREAVVEHLEPRSAYRPWPFVPDLREGDGVLVVFDTEPRLALTQLARVGADRDVEAAIATLHREWLSTNALCCRASASRSPGDTQWWTTPQVWCVPWRNSGSTHRGEDRFGQSSMAAARVLLESDGRCTGCDAMLDLVSSEPAVRTVDSPDDWPAVLCAECQRAMHESGFTAFLDYRFSLHPSCPRCEARRTLRSQFGMPVAMFDTVPWRLHQGCRVTPEQWTCSVCDHQW